MRKMHINDLKILVQNAATTKAHENQVRKANMEFNDLMISIVANLVSEVESLQKRIDSLEKERGDR